MKTKEKGLSAWQLTMMALGTVIGGSFFLGSSVAIHAAGPSIVLSYILGGALVYFILFALSEMTVANPGAGSFRAFAAEAFGPGTGFVVGWVYWSGLTLGMSSEATAVSILIRNWVPNLPISILGGIIIILVTLLNLLGAEKLSQLESGLAAVKLLAILSFIVIALLLIIGFYPGSAGTGTGDLRAESFMPGGFKSVAGSMLIVMFSYSGFEIIGLAASETRNPKATVPKAIRQTVIILVALYILSIAVLLPLIPTADVNESSSPMVAVLDRNGIGWAGAALNFVLITAILSTMLASVFGLGRILRSLADDGLTPKFLKEKAEVPYRGIIFSGLSMLVGLGIGLLFPSVYLFLVSSGGFAILFTYAVIMATHIRIRRHCGCPPDGKCQLWGYPYTSYIVLIILIAAIFSMPFVAGQTSGLIAGCILVAFFAGTYGIMKVLKTKKNKKQGDPVQSYSKNPIFSSEMSKELSEYEENDRDK